MPDEDIYQFKLRIEQKLFDRLSECAERSGYSTPNQFATEALDQYAELLADLLAEQKEGSRIFRENQRHRLINALKVFEEKHLRK
jgi:hypothetical protein